MEGGQIMNGFTGRILRVNLSTGKITTVGLDEDTARKYFGGRGLGSKILFEELKPGTDPFGPDNKLVFATGPITGTPVGGNSRYVAMAKSPVTGGWGEAHSSGSFGPELKFAGFDAVIVEGVAEKPTYLWIHDGEAELRDAAHLWGKVTGEVRETIRKELNDERIKVVSVGPGGEILVHFACIMSYLSRAAGRCGLGAVMGSKKLKAVAVRGSGKVGIADEARFRKLSKKAVKESMAGWGQGLRDNGTNGGLVDLSRSGRLPTEHFRRSTFESDKKITGETFTKTILVDRHACFACPVACKRVVEADKPYKVDREYGGPEYETVGSFGSTCRVDDIVTISKANELCNKYGLDTISTGMVIGFAMECYEKGVITKDDTGGIDLSWGNPEAVLRLVPMIALRQGIGDTLAEGEEKAAQRLGKGAEKFVMTIKGQELPMHEPRGKKGVGLSYATSNRGACHLQSPHDDSFESELAPEIGITEEAFPREVRDRVYAGPEKAKLVKIGQDLWSLYDCLVWCKFLPYPAGISIATVTGIIQAVTGWDVTPMELLTVGERAFNISKAFNVREGLSRRDDVLPARIAEPLPDGPFKGETITKEGLDVMLDAYYEARGWDIETGNPTRKKLEELELDEVVVALGRLDKLP